VFGPPQETVIVGAAVGRRGFTRTRRADTFSKFLQFSASSLSAAGACGLPKRRRRT
jgi:hypothetical protein